MTISLDAMDRAIILATQEGLPLVPEPYAAVANSVGLSEKEVMERLARLYKTGIIRRIAAVPNHYALGYRFNGMTVWDVADRDAAAAGSILSKAPFVSHCYQRPRHLPIWPYNIFAMIHARDRQTAIDQVDVLSKALGSLSRRHQVLFSTRILKKTGLRLNG